MKRKNNDCLESQFHFFHFLFNFSNHAWHIPKRHYSAYETLSLHISNKFTKLHYFPLEQKKMKNENNHSCSVCGGERALLQRCTTSHSSYFQVSGKTKNRDQFLIMIGFEQQFYNNFCLLLCTWKQNFWYFFIGISCCVCTTPAPPDFNGFDKK